MYRIPPYLPVSVPYIILLVFASMDVYKIFLPTHAIHKRVPKGKAAAELSCPSTFMLAPEAFCIVTTACMHLSSQDSVVLPFTASWI